jgi:hypothetical protein
MRRARTLDEALMTTYDESWRADDQAQLNAVAAISPELGVAVRALANISAGITGRMQLRMLEQGDEIKQLIQDLTVALADDARQRQELLEEVRALVTRVKKLEQRRGGGQAVAV